MSMFERADAIGHGVEEILVPEGLEGLRAEHTLNTTELMKRGLDVRGVLDTIATDNPEKSEDIAALRKKLSELIGDAQETLEKLAATTALSSTLEDLVPTESNEDREGRSPITVEALIDDPELAEKLLKGIAEVGDHAAEGELMDHSLANEAKEVLKEVQPKSGKKYKIALTVAERIFKIVLDANTFGFGGAAYDTIKDILKEFKKRQAKAA